MNVDINGAIEITFSSEMDRTTLNGSTLHMQATYADTMNEMHDEMWDEQIIDRSPMKKSDNSMNSAPQKDSNIMYVPKSGQRDTASADVSEAMKDMMSAYSDASMQNGDSLTSHQYEQFDTIVLTPGVHQWSDSLHIQSSITLSGGSDDFWLFKTDGDLTVNENTVFTLTNGAQAENIVWYVEGDVTIGMDAQFEGTIMSMNEITLEKGSRLNGRMFSQTSITLDNNTVTEPGRLAGPTSSTNR